MSTNKTTNYGLHAWTAGDDFRLHEVNENFAKLDEAVRGRAKVVVGTYTGNGALNRKIVVGKPILALFLENTGGMRPQVYSSALLGGLVLPGFPLGTGCVVEGDHFTLFTKNNDSTYSNVSGYTYVYLAVVDAA